MRPAFHFEELRDSAMGHLRRLMPADWTDHNAHDPGITLLEALCYALSDLARRTDYAVPDLLTAPDGSLVAGALYPTSEILACDPVTDADLRRVILGVPGVRNAWIEPVTVFHPELYYDPAEDSLCLGPEPHRQRVAFSGIWRVLVDVEVDSSEDVPVGGEAHGKRREMLEDAREPLGVAAIEEGVKREVLNQLHRCRRLCEDFEAPEILRRQPVSVAAEIEVRDGCDRDQLLREIARVLHSQVSPRVTFHSLEEMLRRGFRIEELFSGPWSERGFIDPAELEGLERPTGLRSSDFISALMDLEGVAAVKDLRLLGGGLEDPWYLPLEEDHVARLNLDGCAITLRRGEVQWRVCGTAWSQWRDGIVARGPAEDEDFGEVPPLKFSPGKFRNPESYSSFQHHLPRVFGLGPEGLPAGASPERRAQALQLAAYLSCFDQVLGGLFSQLGHVRTLFSLKAGVQSYAAPTAADGTHREEILDPATDWKELENAFARDGDSAPRSQQLLGHLLARFGEEFTGFSLFRDSGRLEEAQREFLARYPEVSGGRGRAFDYTHPSWGADVEGNISGLERRVALKLGLSGYYRRPLSGLPSEEAGGFHLIEHILLRPQPADLEQWNSEGVGRGQWKPLTFLVRPGCRDPYSARLTFVFPAWADAFKDSGGNADELRRFVEATVRDETPAHLAVELLWLDSVAMAHFEGAYQSWLESMISSA